MSTENTFGSILRDARVKQGIELDTAARHLRLRVDILKTIEESNLDLMPPRGFARNMITSYAHYLGLNAVDVTNRYLNEIYLHEITHSKQSRDAYPSYSASNKSDVTIRASSNYTKGSPKGQLTSSARNSGHNKSYINNSENAFRSRYSSRRNYSLEDEKDNEGTTGRFLRTKNSSKRVHQSHHSALESKQYTNFYSGPRAQIMLFKSKLPIIIAIIVALLIIIFLFTMFFKPVAQNQTPTSSVTGLTDPQNSASSQQNSANTKVAPPKSVAVSYEVAAGQSSYIEIYINDATLPEIADTVSGPANGNYDVTGTLRFVTTNPSAVQLKVQNEVVEPVDENKVGVYTYVVNFQSILEQWNAQHPDSTQNNTTQKQAPSRIGIESGTTS